MLTKVGQVMTTDVAAVREDAAFADIAAQLLSRHVSALPVVDAGRRVVGVVSEGDLLVKEAAVADPTVWGSAARGRRAVMATAETARDLMTSPAVTIGPDASVAEAARLMTARHVKRLPVVTPDGELAGIISRVDVLSVFCRPDKEIRDEILATVIAGEAGRGVADLEVAVRSGIVTLAGAVATDQAAVALLQAIRQVEGVVNVRTRLRLPSGTG